MNGSVHSRVKFSENASSRKILQIFFGNILPHQSKCEALDRSNVKSKVFSFEPFLHQL